MIAKIIPHLFTVGWAFWSPIERGFNVFLRFVSRASFCALIIYHTFLLSSYRVVRFFSFFCEANGQPECELESMRSPNGRDLENNVVLPKFYSNGQSHALILISNYLQQTHTFHVCLSLTDFIKRKTCHAILISSVSDLT